MKTKRGYSLQAKMTYPYMPLKESIRRIITRKDILDSCEKWRSRQQNIPSSYLGDIYDGNVWKRFSSDEFKNYLKYPYCFLVALNVDWFEPFERGVYAVGALYLTILNLPRDLRYKPENIVLVGIIPGPKEPKYNINSYLTPLVLDLSEGWNVGFHIRSSHITIKVALACVSCDIPASRKVCGFLSHNAAFGCNKCLKKFNVSFGSRCDYAGFDRENWVLRTAEQHHQQVDEIRTHVTKTAIRACESKYGVRFSALLALPYFDPITFTAIDVMHNLFLGTAKHMVELWMNGNILDREKLLHIESLVNKFTVPSDIGRLPTNISSGYGGFTANQWRSWITIYSPVVLKSILPNDHLQCWLLYVRACSILCARFIKKTDVNSADLYLLQFCRKCETIYGRNACTPNFHLHLHLKQCFLDFGPSHSFWCFAFERFNGILGSYHTNNRAIEVQLMRRFCNEQSARQLELPPEIMKYLCTSTNQNAPSCDACCVFQTFSLSLGSLNNSDFFLRAESGVIFPLSPCRKKIMSTNLLAKLKFVYNKLYPSLVFPHISQFYDQYGRITLGGDVIGSRLPGPNNAASSVIMAYWPHSGHSTSNLSRMEVGVVQYFLLHETTIVNSSISESKKVKHLFAYVEWKEHHSNVDWFGASATVCTDMYRDSSFIPAQRIACRCAHALMPVNFGSHSETVFVASPLPIRYSL